MTKKRWELVFYKNHNGKTPAKTYLFNLKDSVGRNLIFRKLHLLTSGLFSAGVKNLKQRLWELKIYSGPGYRVYFTIYDDKKIIVFVIGTKGTQSRDIHRARSYLKAYEENI